MHRLLVDTQELDNDLPVLSRAAVNHLKVLRPKDGERIELFDGAGRSREFSFKGGVLSPVGSVSLSPRPAPLTLFACVTKGSRWDWTVEKATELGATRIVPVISERTIVRIPADEREAKRARWMRIAEDAARQSDAKWLPDVLAPVDFAESLALVRETACFVGALTNPPPQPLLQALMDSRQSRSPAFAKASAAAQALSDKSADKPFHVPHSLSIFVGPEGDFTPSELLALCEIATPVTFGASVLRAETAAIYGLSVLKSFLEAGS